MIGIYEYELLELFIILYTLTTNGSPRIIENRTMTHPKRCIGFTAPILEKFDMSTCFIPHAKNISRSKFLTGNRALKM